MKMKLRGSIKSISSFGVNSIIKLTGQKDDETMIKAQNSFINDFDVKYEILECIGEGTAAFVKKCKSKLDDS